MLGYVPIPYTLTVCFRLSFALFISSHIYNERNLLNIRFYHGSGTQSLALVV